MPTGGARSPNLDQQSRVVDANNGLRRSDSEQIVGARRVHPGREPRGLALDGSLGLVGCDVVQCHGDASPSEPLRVIASRMLSRGKNVSLTDWLDPRDEGRNEPDRRTRSRAHCGHVRAPPLRRRCVILRQISMTYGRVPLVLGTPASDGRSLRGLIGLLGLCPRCPLALGDGHVSSARSVHCGTPRKRNGGRHASERRDREWIHRSLLARASSAQREGTARRAPDPLCEPRVNCDATRSARTPSTRRAFQQLPALPCVHRPEAPGCRWTARSMLLITVFGHQRAERAHFAPSVACVGAVLPPSRTAQATGFSCASPDAHAHEPHGQAGGAPAQFGHRGDHRYASGANESASGVESGKLRGI